MGAGLGVGFTYSCDPVCGHARHKKVADRAISLIAQGERLAEHKGKDILNRAEGVCSSRQGPCFTVKKMYP